MGFRFCVSGLKENCQEFRYEILRVWTGVFRLSSFGVRGPCATSIPLFWAGGTRQGYNHEGEEEAAEGTPN